MCIRDSRSKTSLRYVNDTSDNVLELLGDDTSSDRWDLAVGAVGILQNGWIPYIEYQHTFGASNSSTLSLVSLT